MTLDIAIVGDGSAARAAAEHLAQVGATTQWRVFGAHARPEWVDEDHFTARAVTSIFSMGDHFTILRGNDMLDVRTVIVATGLERVAPFPGEKELRGRGVSYCAECDADLYRGKAVAAVVTSPDFAHELDHLAQRAGTVVAFGVSESAMANVTPATAPLAAIGGENHVKSILLADSTTADVSGVFVLKHEIAVDVLVPGIETDAADRAVVNEQQGTNLALCFAAGSCANSPLPSDEQGRRAAAQALRDLETHQRSLS